MINFGRLVTAATKRKEVTPIYSLIYFRRFFIYLHTILFQRRVCNVLSMQKAVDILNSFSEKMW
jgi:hypothetical protein